MTDEELQQSRQMYVDHLAKMVDGATLRVASMRVLAGTATRNEVIAVMHWELDEAICSLPPMAPSTRPTDEDHASACAMRAKSMLRQLEKLLANEDA